MALEFDPSQAVYDEDRELVVFMAMDGAVLVRCAVTHEALLQRAQARAKSAKELLDTYRANADDIHRVAKRKYRARVTDTDGSVLVLQRDLAPR
jgi:hypothetical protein